MPAACELALTLLISPIARSQILTLARASPWPVTRDAGGGAGRARPRADRVPRRGESVPAAPRGGAALRRRPDAAAARRHALARARRGPQRRARLRRAGGGRGGCGQRQRAAMPAPRSARRRAAGRSPRCRARAAVRVHRLRARRPAWSICCCRRAFSSGAGTALLSHHHARRRSRRALAPSCRPSGRRCVCATAPKRRRQPTWAIRSRKRRVRCLRLCALLLSE